MNYLKRIEAAYLDQKLEIEQKYVNLKQNGSSIVYGLYIMCLGSSGKPKTKEIES